MLTLHNDFADFLRLLNERNVRYIVVGGYAVAYKSLRRFMHLLAPTGFTQLESRRS